jgi:hypothetical protein
MGTPAIATTETRQEGRCPGRLARMPAVYRSIPVVLPARRHVASMASRRVRGRAAVLIIRERLWIIVCEDRATN